MEDEMNKKLALLLLVCSLAVGCAKQVSAPVPGSTGTPDAIAFRVAADAQAALHSIKTWATCSAKNFPVTVDVDGAPAICDPTSGPFPAKMIPLLNTAITSYNTLQALGHAYHDGTNTDQAALQAAESKLQSDVSVVIAAGGK
jgi:hypothetical protein